MHASCSHCGFEFEVDLTYLKSDSVVVQCPKCRHVQTVRKPAKIPPPADAALETSDQPEVQIIDKVESHRPKVVLPRALIAGSVALALGLTAWLWMTRPWTLKPPPLVVKVATDSKVANDLIDRWRREHRHLEQEDQHARRQHVETGFAQLELDSVDGVRQAEVEFEQALAVDPQSDRALAGWVLAVVRARGRSIESDFGHQIEGSILQAERRGADPIVYVAHAHFLLATEANWNDIVIVAERGMAAESPRLRALSLLAAAEAVLPRNLALASAKFHSAAAIDGKSLRVQLFGAKLAVAQGRYRDALTTLEQLRSEFSVSWWAIDQLVDLYAAVGEVAKARHLVELIVNSPKRHWLAEIKSAALALRYENDVPRAVSTLEGLVNRGALRDGDRSIVLTELAIAHRRNGDLGAARKVIETAVELTPHGRAARFELLAIAIEQNDASLARAEFMAQSPSITDGALRALLDARVLLVEKKLEEALARLRLSYQVDSRRIDALLLSGAVAARLGR